MHQRSWKALIAGGAALTVGLTLTAFGAPSHAEGIAGITSEAPGTTWILPRVWCTQAG